MTKITSLVPRREEKDETEAALEWVTENCERARTEGPFGVSCELTPARAAVLLTLNPENRVLNQSRLRDYSTDIREGKWELNGEPLIVSVDGIMNDGQHRCAAVVETGLPIQTMITFGVSRESRLTVDTGKVRTSGDFMTMSGVTDGVAKAAVSSMLFQWEHKQGISVAHSDRPTKVQVQQTYWDHRDEIEAAHAYHHKQGAAVLASRGLTTFMGVILSRVDREAARTFLDAIATGRDLKMGDPRLVARERLRSAKRLVLRDRVELLLRAWNMWREGKTSIRSIPIIGNLPQPK